MNISQKVLELNSFKEFNTVQEQALKSNLFNSNIVIAAPTSSGKTIIAELAALDSIINNKKKVIYTCPLKALASEHFNDWKKKYSKKLNIKLAITTGDLDSSSKYLSAYDLIFATNEKVDSLLRHDSGWLSNVGVLIVDEIHELDSSRGPTLEMVITKLRELNPKLRVVALSATIPNAEEISEWLNAELVKSDYRPVELNEGVFFNDTIFFDSFEQKITGSAYSQTPVESLAYDTLKKEKQGIIFLNSRRNAESMAKRLSPMVYSLLSDEDKKHLKKVSEELLHVLEQPTEQCKKLSNLVEKGVAFHHAGLMAKQRTLIEDAFKENKLKILSATTTLGAGINLPAFRVIIPTLYRYTDYGMQRIKVSEYKQLCGRAGRPKFDSKGEAIVIVKHELEKEEIVENFILGEIERVESKLSHENILRTHLLSLISSRFVFDSNSLKKFFSKTFYAKQYGELDFLIKRINHLVLELEEMGFVEIKKNNFFPTLLGKRISDLYLDPFTAKKFIDLMQKDLNDFSVFYLISSALELAPWSYISKNSEMEMFEKLQEHKELLPFDVDSEQFLDASLLEKFNLSLLFKDWCSEVSEQELMNSFNVQPGILHSKLMIADWLLYSASEIAKITNLKKAMLLISKTRKRMKYGIKTELIPLVEFKGIGRVRARRLFNANLTKVSDLKRVDEKDLGIILKSSATARLIKNQLKQN